MTRPSFDTDASSAARSLQRTGIPNPPRGACRRGHQITPRVPLTGNCPPEDWKIAFPARLPDKLFGPNRFVDSSENPDQVMRGL
jgi:hypothetical protein